jgi:simple sugar transport system ATP-binding protein
MTPLPSGGGTAVAMRDIVKRFDRVLANDRVNFDVGRGEVHALLGENGAGKSTLMNILYGLYQPDAGAISIMETPIRIRSPADALRAGIGMVPQHFALIPTLSVVENVILGSSPHWLRIGRAASEVAAKARQYGWDINPWARTGDLSPGDHQRIEILKALHRGARILVLDEPTSVLAPTQADELIATLRRFAADGGSVIFISHKLAEVLRVSDRITVMRDGRVVATVTAPDTTRSELARLMIGRDVGLPRRLSTSPGEAVVLGVRDVSARGATARSSLRKVSFTVRAGEVFGIAGVDGNGQSELAAILCGLRRDYSGEVTLFGEQLAGYLRGPERRKVGHVPDDRRRQGLALDLGVGENLILRDLAAGRMLPPFAALSGRARDLFARFKVKAAGMKQPVRYLSGGNQQRIVLARECGDNPAFLVAVQPTQGLDIAATEDVYDTIARLRERQAAIVYISTELDEILALSDRIGVMSEGALVGVMDKDAVDLPTLGLMMGGGHG